MTADVITREVDTATFVRRIARIRAFETELLEMFGQNKLSGTTHTCIGQEICAVAVYANIDPARDGVFSNHRCHGHFLAYGGPMDGLLAEIMGREGGVCQGRGGSQHLSYGRFHSNGIQGGGLPIAAGYAWRLRAEGKNGIVVAHIGDGTLGEGVVYETLNIASLLSLPLLVVLEHNGYAQSTDTGHTIAGDYLKRFEGFGVGHDRRKADDPAALSSHMAGVIESVRGGRPFVQVLDTFRLMAHSKGDDDRPKELLDKAWKADFLASGLDAGDPVMTAAWSGAKDEVAAVSADVESRPLAALGRAEAFVEPGPMPFASSADLLYHPPSGDERAKRINEELNLGLDRLMQETKDVFLIGEDVADPYGGAFKVTRGLSTKYPDQVLSSPISEAAITGFGNGAALAGARPIVEIMFGDFVTLAVDQLVNQAAKMNFMYAGQARVPLTVRMVSGGYRGYGATHSQSLEAMLCGVPGLKVVALSMRHDPAALLHAVVHDDDPVVFVENKQIYAERPHSAPPDGFWFEPVAAATAYPNLHYSTGADEADVTVVTYGGLTDQVEAAMTEMIVEDELDFEYFILTQLHPLHVDDVAASVRRTRKLLVVEEGPAGFGVGSEVVAQVHQALDGTPFSSRREGALPVPIPSSRSQELDVLMSSDKIAETITQLSRSA